MAASQLPENAYLCRDGDFWILRWRECPSDVNDFVNPEERQSVWIGPANGPQQLTKEQAERLACGSVMTLTEFVENVFVPEHVLVRNLSGRTHYQAILKHVIGPEEVGRAFQSDSDKLRTKLKPVADWPYLGQVRLCDTRPEDVRRLIDAALERGYSTQTAMHIRNAVGAIFKHARKMLWFSGDNPARFVTLPNMIRKEAPVLTLAQVREVLVVMKYPERELTLFIILTGMYVGEICGLQWKRVNLTDDWLKADGVPIPPKNIAVSKQWYLGELGNLYRKSRNRNLRIPEPLMPVLRELSSRAKFTGPEDFLFVSRTGKPISGAHIAANRLKPIGNDLQMPWLSWHVFRRTHTALMRELGMRSLEFPLN